MNEPIKKLEQRENSELEPGFKMTELGPLPEDWSLIKLGDIADIKYGKAKPKTRGSIPVIGSGGVYDHTNISLVDFPTIIIGRKGKAGFAWLAEEPSWPSDTTFYLAWRRQLDIQYIFHYLTLKPLSGEYAKTTLPSIQKPDLENYMIPFPPLDEQPKIAYTLNSIQRGIGETGKVIDAARELKKSLMRHLFTYGPVPYDQVDNVPLKETEIGPVPERWDVVGLNKAAIKMYGGGTPSTKDASLWDGTIPWTTTAVIGIDDIFLRDYQRKITEKGLNSSSTKIAPVGSVLIGTRVGVGKAAVATFDVAVNQDITVLVPTENVLSEYIAYILKMPAQKQWFEDRKRGATIKGVPRGDIAELMIPLPPLPEQREIARILQAVDRKIEAEENRKQALEALFKTLLHYLMTGKIRVKDLIGSQGINSRL